MNRTLTEQQLEELRPLAAVIEGAITDTPIRLGTDDWGTMLASAILVRVAAYMGGVLPPVAQAGDWLTRGTRDLSIPEQAPVDDGVRVPCLDCSGAPLFRPDEITDHIVQQHTDARPASSGIRGLLEHVGIDTTGRDIIVAGRVVDPAPAFDEDAQRATRRNSLLNLLDRLDRTRTLTSEERTLLRQHIDAETREHDTMRSVAAGNKRHVQVMYADLQQAQRRAGQAEESLRIAHETSNKAEAARAEEERLRLALAQERDRWKDRAEAARHEREVTAADLETADRIRAGAQRDRDQQAAVLTEVLRQFTHETHPGRRCLQSGHVPVETVERWRSVVAPIAERPWWVGVAEIRAELEQAQTAIKRVRDVVDDGPPAGTAPGGEWEGGWDSAMDAARAALDGTEQQAREG
jgi:hypothetical protein